MCFIFLVYLILNVSVIISGEYYINESNPSYLYYKFSNIKEEIFPFDIRINISLSRILGTLLYSIDRNMNQLILTLSDIKEPTMTIEFRKKEYYVNISKLCGCGRCRYGIIDLRIQIQFNIFLQCNPRDFQNFKFIENKEVNEVYPLPYNMTNTDKTLNEAQLWLVNHQLYQDVYPNPEQLLGCIFNVWYKDELIKFTNITNNIGRKCIKTCIGDVCNGGHCYEAFDGEPVCDCTNTFLNGPYCNDTIVPVNVRSLSQNFQFDILKVSWRSSSKQLLTCNNSKVQIQLYINDISSHGLILIFEYKYNKNYSLIIKGILSETYVSNKEYILLVYFLETTINIQLLNNGSWSHIIIPTNLDIRKEVFTSVTLRSGDGYIDFYHKTPQQYTWRKVNIQNKVVIATVFEYTVSIKYPVMLIHNTGSQCNESRNHSTNSIHNWIYVVCIVLVFVGIISERYLRISYRFIMVYNYIIKNISTWRNNTKESEHRNNVVLNVRNEDEPFLDPNNENKEMKTKSNKKSII